MFSQACVSHSVHGGERSLSWGYLSGGLCPEGWSLSRGSLSGGSLCPGRLPPYGEERAERILLECILVMAVNSTCALANVTYLPFSIDICDEKSNVFLMHICSVFYVGERTINGLSENTWKSIKWCVIYQWYMIWELHQNFTDPTGITHFQSV